jgi:hypothetical protein
VGHKFLSTAAAATARDRRKKIIAFSRFMIFIGKKHGLSKKKFQNFWSETNRGEWGCMKRKIVWGKVKYSCYFSAITSLKFVSTKNTVRVSFCPVFFYTAPFSPTFNIFHI